MAFNGYKLNYPTTRVVVNDDNEEVRSILSDDQSSWVLFNPDSDILSSTTQNDGSDNQSIDQDEDTTPRSSQYQTQEREQHTEHEDDGTDTDSLIDNLDPSHPRLEGMFSRPYNRITNWNTNTDNIVDDNVASWDLDADLSHQSLDTSILRLKQFYGDDLLKNLNKQELQKFKKIHHNLRTYLNTKPQSPLLYQLLNVNRAKVPVPQLNYNRYLQKTINSYYDYDDLTSETASSSLVICGGGDSWGDV